MKAERRIQPGPGPAFEVLSGLEIIQQFFFLPVRRREGRIFGWGCWGRLGSPWPQPSSTEVPGPRQWCLALLNWDFVFSQGHASPPLNGDNKAAEHGFVVGKTQVCSAL